MSKHTVSLDKHSPSRRAFSQVPITLFMYRRQLRMDLFAVPATERLLCTLLLPSTHLSRMNVSLQRTGMLRRRNSISAFSIPPGAAVLCSICNCECCVATPRYRKAIKSLGTTASSECLSKCNRNLETGRIGSSSGHAYDFEISLSR